MADPKKPVDTDQTHVMGDGAEPELTHPIREDADLTRPAEPDRMDPDKTELAHGIPEAEVTRPAPESMSSGGTSKIDVGQRINNNYEVKQVLKSGGMGEVFRGENVFTGDSVAIKVVLPELAEDERVGLMFQREARTLSQLSDEAIVGYQNFVHDPDLGVYCLIMEFISGTPLSEHVEQNGPLHPVEATSLMVRLARGLSKAHAREVYHRDLSPDNVMLADGEMQSAKIIDFGIAKSNVVQEGTVAGQFAGKFKYVSPEQLGHFGGDIGPGTDIYGLGLLIAATLIGRPLDMGTSVVDAVNARKEIPNLSDVPAQMRPILSHMLEPDPANRPDSMDRLIQLLDHPHLLPKKYFDGKMPAKSVLGLTPGGGGAQAVAGGVVKQPPGVVTTGGSLPSTDGTGQSLPPRTVPPQPKERGGGALVAVLAVVFLAILGGAGLYGFSQGLFGGEPAITDGPPGTNEPVALTPARFLAQYLDDSCSFATQTTDGEVAAFAQDPSILTGLPAAFEGSFERRPELSVSQVSEAQCPALDFLRGVQLGDGEEVYLSLNGTELQSRAEMTGRLFDPEGREVWLALVSPEGRVYSLSESLSSPVEGERSLRFGLRLAGSEPTPQLLIAVASDVSTLRAATLQPGTMADRFLPLLAEELSEIDNVAVTAALVMLVPAN